MGKSIAITFTVELLTSGESGRLFQCTPAQWRVKARNRIPGYGSPTAANLASYVTTFEKSTEAGGCNAHLGVQKVLSAVIIHQASREHVAKYVSKG